MPQATTPQATPAPPAGSSAANALLREREELRGQLLDLSQRRAQLVAQRAGATLAKTAELDARLAAMDARTASLESQLFTTNDEITRGFADAGVTQTNTAQAVQNAVRTTTRDATRGATIGVVAVLALFMMWRGVGNVFRRKRRAESLTDNSTQLAQLQQSLDVIAVEVERISEAQRYTAKLMNERGIGAGEGQAVALPAREPAGTQQRR